MIKIKVVTHSDFDGWCCGVLLSEVYNPEEIEIAEPSQIRDGKIKLTKYDVVADLPIPTKKVLMALDHHRSTSMEKTRGNWFIVDPTAPSCAGLIYDEYIDSYPALKKWKQLVAFADKIDSANFTLKEFGEVNAYNKISMTLKSFDRELDKFYLRYLIKKMLELESLEAVSNLDWVTERHKYKVDSIERWKKLIKKYLTLDEGIIITDIRESEDFIPKGNPFELYKLHPNSLVAIHVVNTRENVLISLSENIFNRKNKVDLGAIAVRYFGGGHKGAAGFSVKTDRADTVLKEVIKEIKKGNK